jgi:hypothetical protein
MSLSPALLKLRDALTVVDEREPVAGFTLPLATVSEANSHAHWRQRSTRAKAQRDAVTLVLASSKAFLRARLEQMGRRGLVVLLVRVAPRELDSDNLAGALKACRDAVAAVLGVDDREPRITWVVDQRKNKAAAVEVRFYDGKEAHT